MKIKVIYLLACVLMTMQSQSQVILDTLYVVNNHFWRAKTSPMKCIPQAAITNVETKDPVRYRLGHSYAGKNVLSITINDTYKKMMEDSCYITSIPKNYQSEWKEMMGTGRGHEASVQRVGFNKQFVWIDTALYKIVDIPICLDSDVVFMCEHYGVKHRFDLDYSRHINDPGHYDLLMDAMYHWNMRPLVIKGNW